MKLPIQKRKWTTGVDDGWEDSQIRAQSRYNGRSMSMVAPFDGNTKDCALVVLFLGVMYTHKADWH